MEKEHPEEEHTAGKGRIKAISVRWWGKLRDVSSSRHAAVAVFVWSFFNPLLIPFPAESLLAPLALVNRKRALYLTALASVATTLGAALGYFLSVFMYDALVAPLIAGLEIESQLAALSAAAGPFTVFWVVFVAALTLIPDPPFIAAAGLLRVDFVTFIIAFFLGRTLRFLLVIGAVVLFGRKAWLWFEKGERKLETALALFLITLAAVALFIFLR